ncbi:hypothetical protein P7C70_g1669, partial [Phenoliferia sp. Uapishka_3]
MRPTSPFPPLPRHLDLSLLHLPNTMATAHSLAHELLSHIFSFTEDPTISDLEAYFAQHHDEPGYQPPPWRTLAAVSLVCRAWRQPAQQLLWEHVRIPLCHSLPDELGVFVVLDGAELDVVDWEEYSARRLYAPRRAVLAGGSFESEDGWLEKGSPELRWVAGVKRLKLEGGAFGTSFLQDPGLQDLEHLNLKAYHLFVDSDSDEEDQMPPLQSSSPFALPLHLTSLAAVYLHYNNPQGAWHPSATSLFTNQTFSIH